MNFLLWVLQIVLAAGFIGAGGLKVAKTKEWLHENKVEWTDSFSQRNIKIIGALEILAALSLLVPWGTGILPVLTPIGAIGLAVLMVPAAIIYGKRREISLMSLSIVILVLAAFLAWGRLAEILGVR